MKRLYEQFFAPRICTRCKKMHVTEDYYCEHCLLSLLAEEPIMIEIK